ncbi:MAG: hypothetical protein A2992_09380 [Elusimicrobia bacterium RIFCSPLOWO2_01_FULL_59_12]|nr:MAG: hypothetical protein A2992_09380 [Elusimicrobia bacterium RIFCSPLOWO2_01_FULL_59_12]
MNDERLNQRLAAHYAAKALPRERLALLVQQIDGPFLFNRQWRKWAVSGATAACVIAGSYSLGSQPAAQIRLSKPNGMLCTLYQVKSTEESAGIHAGVWEVDGLRVTLWHEKGLLLGLAEPATKDQ